MMITFLILHLMTELPFFNFVVGQTKSSSEFRRALSLASGGFHLRINNMLTQGINVKLLDSGMVARYKTV
jgi:hypothetical protein